MLADQVQTNLDHFHLWTDLSQLEIHTSHGAIQLVKGTPPAKLHPDDADHEDEHIEPEYILPSITEDSWTIRQWDEAFKGIEGATGKFPRRIVMAMVTNDGTIVYYFVNSGLTKPRKN